MFDLTNHQITCPACGKKHGKFDLPQDALLHIVFNSALCVKCRKQAERKEVKDEQR
jgi:hypothetical protein